jgi:hypothetical protein
MSQADAEDRHFTRKGGDHFFADTGGGGTSRTGRKYDMAWSHNHNVRQCYGVIPDYFYIRLYCPDKLKEIIRKTVVIIDQ